MKSEGENWEKNFEERMKSKLETISRALNHKNLSKAWVRVLNQLKNLNSEIKTFESSGLAIGLPGSALTCAFVKMSKVQELSFSWVSNVRYTYLREEDIHVIRRAHNIANFAISLN